MKVKITKKQILANYRIVISVGYCHLQTLLKYESARYYTDRICGWGADIYISDGVAIVTGYAPFGTKIPYSIIKEYEEKAIKLDEKNRKDGKDGEEEMTTLFKEFLNKTKKELVFN